MKSEDFEKFQQSFRDDITALEQASEILQRVKPFHLSQRGVSFILEEIAKEVIIRKYEMLQNERIQVISTGNAPTD